MYCLSFAVGARTPTILVSVDGFASDYLDQYSLGSLNAMQENGVKAAGLRPVFPSKTFPSHISMVTGVYPATHGIIYNRFYRRDTSQYYSMGLGKQDSSWLQASPIWSIAEQQGVKSGVYFWPESETLVKGITPSYFYDYDHQVPNIERVEQVKTWLALPQDERPELIILYFSIVDSAGHDYGRNSTQLKQAIAEVDSLLKQLQAIIKNDLKGQGNLIVVSDHGMTEVDPAQVIYWQDRIQPAQDTVVISAQTQLLVYTDNKQELADFTRVFSDLGADTNVYVKGQFPVDWHWQNDAHNRIPDLVVNLAPPKIFAKTAKAQSYSRDIPVLTHGYDPNKYPAMDGIFFATGPSFRTNVTVPVFDNIHVFSVIAEALDLQVDHVDASLSEVESMFVETFNDQ